jgi:hypothetical protein
VREADLPFDGDATIIEALELLRYGRAQIAAGKWCQGNYSDDAGNRCAVGWIITTDPLQFSESLALQELYAALPPTAQQLHIWPTPCVIHYNDTHTRKSVLALYDRAIAALDARHGGDNA